jgi:hypothetical protein
MWVKHVAQMDEIRNKYWASVKKLLCTVTSERARELLVSFSKTSELNELKPPLLLPQH